MEVNISVVRALDYISLVFVVWAIAAAIPLSWFWFSPGPLFISDSTTSHPPGISFTRKIHRPVLMKYQVTIRDIETKSVVCDPSSEPFTYRPDASVPDDANLVWWTGGDDRCWPQEPGTYIVETCWTATNLFWGIAPDKTACVTSNPFTIVAAESEVINHK